MVHSLVIPARNHQFLHCLYTQDVSIVGNTIKMYAHPFRVLANFQGFRFQPKALASTLKSIKISRFTLCRCRSTITQGSQAEYDVVIVGGGHAGTEAACTAARMGRKTLLVTHKVDTIGEMSCNPAFGGVGKGHLMREVDALDGLCAVVADFSGTQYKCLNKRRGPAVWGPRAQIDRKLYKKHMQKMVLSTPNLTVIEAPVEDLILEEVHKGDNPVMKFKCSGVTLENNEKILGTSVILTTGTFLRGCINIGLSVTPAGRMGDRPAIGLAKSLEKAGFKMGRLKTGTPPRLDKNSIDFSELEKHEGDDPPEPFSFLNDRVWLQPEEQMLCHIVRSDTQVEKIVQDTLHLNKHIKEEINGPRFCPSVESKVLRFPGRRHQIWLEPEGFDSDLIYPNGLSCTMPEEFQQKLVNSIEGLEKARIVKPGYGVEYDFIDPRQLKPSLETLKIQNLFLAGQINGTTGYEEAAAQGVIAGINAALKTDHVPPFIVDRTEGYIGVLIDDLTTHGTNEPYRMFTSRAEFRITLRADNADLRLTRKGYEIGCVSDQRYEKLCQTERDLQDNQDLLKSTKLPANQWYDTIGFQYAKRKTHAKSAQEMLFIPGMTLEKLTEIFPGRFDHLVANKMLATRLFIEAKYEYEVADMMEEISEVRKDEHLVIPDTIDYMRIDMSTDAKTKLAEARPHTIAAASRIPGMTPAAIVNLLRYIRKTLPKSTTLEPS